jgi:predicted tellurium resistance membrane protein TerC
MFEWMFDINGWMALLALTSLEIVLGIDNIIFISILASRLPAEKRNRVRLIGLALAMVMRIILVFSVFWLMKLTFPLFSIFDHSFSGKDLILLFGGLFLLGKSTMEIHHSLEGTVTTDDVTPIKTTVASVLVQIIMLDIVFSIDSVITAVGMVEYISVMIIAILISVGVMMVSAAPISDFVEKHPALKMLALSFLILIGVTLIGEGLQFHIPKGYIYFAMAFSIIVEFLNIKARKKSKPQPVALHKKLEH